MAGDEGPADTFHGGKASSLSQVMAGASTWERGLAPIGVPSLVALWACTAVSVLLIAGDLWAQRTPLTTLEPDYFIFGWAWTRTLLDQGAWLLPVHASLAVAGLLAAGLTGGFRLAGHRVLLGLAVLLVAFALSFLVPASIVAIAVANGLLWVLYGLLIVVVTVVVVVTVIAILCS